MILLFFMHVLFMCILNGQQAVISGFITEKKSGEAIYGANAYLKDTHLGIISNIEGYYVIPQIQPGEYTLIVSFIGFTEFKQDITLTEGQLVRINIELEPTVLAGEAIEVSGERTAYEREVQISKMHLNTRQITNMPAIGEVDLFRALQQLPGVNAETDFSAGLIVRGGDSDQNLILLDGITVYNPSHLMGMFSNFITEGLRDAELIKGGYPAEYGGRLSSVLNVRSKDGNQKEFKLKGEVSMLSSKILAEGPLYNGAYLITARRTYVDKLLDLGRKLGVTDFTLPYYFYDIQANIFQNLTPNDRLSITAYMGDDVLNWTDAEMYFSWGNQTISTRLRHIFNPRLFSNFLLAFSQFEIVTEFGGDDLIHEKDVIKDISTKGDLTYYYSDDTEIKFGYEYKNLGISYRSWFGDNEQFRLIQNPNYLGLYSQVNWHPHRWVIAAGLRLNYYDIQQEKYYLAPRLSVKRLFGEWSALTFSINRYYQFIYSITDEFNMRVINAWVAQDSTINTAYANELLSGFSTKLPGNINFTFEAYYKQLYNLYIFRNDFASFDMELLDPKASEIFDKTDADAFGYEILMKRELGNINGMFSYTQSWVIKQIVNEPRYWANWDRRHNMKVVLNWRLNKKWDFGTTFNWYTGLPYTSTIGFHTYYETGYSWAQYIEIPGIRNGQRLPSYNRLDLGATRHFRFKKWNMDFYLNAINLTNHPNYFQQRYITDPLNEESPPEKVRLQMLPLLVTFGFRVDL